MRYFSSFYLYAKLFQKSSFFYKKFSEEDYIYIYHFNESLKIKETCSQFNFSLYNNYLTSNNIDCFSRKNLLFYFKKDTQYSINEEINYPYCICLPLYCIKNLNKNFDPKNIEFVENITLPEKCENNLQYYQKKAHEENINKNIEIDISKDKLRAGDNLIDELEDQFIKLSFQILNSLKGFSFIIFSIIDNKSVKEILTIFINNLSKIKTIFIILIIISICFLYTSLFVLIIINLYKISKSIYEFKIKLKHF